MGKDIIDVTLTREDGSTEAWGFRLSGGKDQGQPLAISQVIKDSVTQKAGLLPNDFLMSIGNIDVHSMTHSEAERTIMNAGDRFSMVVERKTEGASRKISFEKSATTFALRLGAGTPEVVREAEAFISNVPFSADTPALSGVNFKKFDKTPADISASKTLEDVSKKANLQKDWNCPWVSKDGSRLKQAVRYIDEPTAQVATSHQHYYSSPGSILAPEPQISKEQLEALIREHGQESRPQSRAAQQAPSRPKFQDDFQEPRQEELYCREREEDSQAPPELEPINIGYEQFQQAGMGGYGQDSGYEPSADELIEVLKNLENLAAADPQLYRTIVDQIKGGAMGQFFQSNGNGQASAYEQQMYEQQQREAEIYEQQQQQQMQMQMEQQAMYEEQQRMMQQQEESSRRQQSSRVEQQQTMSSSSSSVRQEQQSSSVSSLRQESSSSMVQESSSMKQVYQQSFETASSMGLSEEEFKQVQRMKRLEAEAQEEVRVTLAAQREAKMKKLHPAVPPPPKEITVIAGDGKAVKVLLGGEKELEDCRKQVAEAAGLKHVPLPDFDDTDSAWAGSLKKAPRGRAQEQEDSLENPWAGSLRHVDAKKNKGKLSDKEDTYGSAPWMGTLRHVVHDNKVTRNYGVNQHQSKRYPDEDAGNPYEKEGGSAGRSAYPVGPAAIINGAALSREEMARREEEEELERIRSNIGSKTVSTALLQVLMPKLLKMHEAKYEPMDKVDASKIMEEILGMQAGLNPDQQADANEEAEMIIRAIMQEEVDKSIYSKMADDLEMANRRMKTKKSKKLGQESSAPISA